MLAPEKQQYVVSAESQLGEALAAIEANKHRSVIVLSPQGFVVGTLSDGDVRKALLDGRLLQAPVSSVMNTRFISLRRDEGSKARKIFDETHIFLIPVVDEEARLLDVLEAY